MFSCDSCNRTFDNQHNLNSHKTSISHKRFSLHVSVDYQSPLKVPQVSVQCQTSDEISQASVECQTSCKMTQVSVECQTPWKVCIAHDNMGFEYSANVLERKCVNDPYHTPLVTRSPQHVKFISPIHSPIMDSNSSKIPFSWY